MGRKKLSKETVVVDVDGTLMAWTDGYFSGDQKLINQAKGHADLGDSGLPVKVGLTYRGPDVTPGNKNALSAAAALIAINPHRSRVVSAPQYVLDAIDDALGRGLPPGPDGPASEPKDLTEHIKAMFPDA